MSRYLWIDLTDLQYQLLGEILTAKQAQKKESRKFTLDEWAPRWIYRCFAALARSWHGAYLTCLMEGIPQIVPPPPKKRPGQEGSFAVGPPEPSKHLTIRPSDLDLKEVEPPTEEPPVPPGCHRITVEFPDNSMTALQRGLAIQNRHARNYPEEYGKEASESFMEWAQSYVLGTMARVKTGLDTASWDDEEDAIYPGFTEETKKLGPGQIPNVEPTDVG